MPVIYLLTVLWDRNLGGSSSLGWLRLGGLGWPHCLVRQLTSSLVWGLNSNSSPLFHLVSHPASMVLHTVLAGFQRVARENKPQWTSTYLHQTSICITFANVPVANASHKAKTNSRGGVKTPSLDGRPVKFVTIFVIYHRGIMSEKNFCVG